MLASWNIFKALLPYFLLSAFALVGAWVALETVWMVWHYSLRELPDNAVFNMFILFPFLGAACFVAHMKRRYDEEFSTAKSLLFIAVMIAACLYLQTGLLAKLTEFNLRQGPAVTVTAPVTEAETESR
ncbi:MAG: hypothetical protein WC028_29535 [Candidatus Obscuribacterales bacterium]